MAVAVGVAVAVAVGVAVAVAVGVGLAVGVGEGVGVGTPPGACTSTPLGEPVLKKPTVAFVGLGGWSASNRKLYMRGEANRIGILICRKRFRAPGERACVPGNIPRCAAIPSISQSAIMWPTGLLDRRMKPDITDVDSRSQGNSERLNGAIEVLVIERGTS